MKIKTIFIATLLGFLSSFAMEEKNCEITFHNDLDTAATINNNAIKPHASLKLVLQNGKSFAVRTQPYVTGGYVLRSSPVPIVRGTVDHIACAATLSFLIKGKKDCVYSIADEPNILFYFSR